MGTTREQGLKPFQRVSVDPLNWERPIYNPITVLYAGILSVLLL